jgi:hypothetical protein
MMEDEVVDVTPNILSTEEGRLQVALAQSKLTSQAYEIAWQTEQFLLAHGETIRESLIRVNDNEAVAQLVTLETAVREKTQKQADLLEILSGRGVAWKELHT